MEPPPGPCVSPPGTRPVPPPRKGSMERRPLSPLRRGGEQMGSGDACSDISARGSKPGTPERAAVTQRVLIVMQSHASPVTSHKASQLENTPITSQGTAPPPAERAPTPQPTVILVPDQGEQEASPAERAPKQTHQVSAADTGGGLPSGTIIHDCGGTPPVSVPTVNQLTTLQHSSTQDQVVSLPPENIQVDMSGPSMGAHCTGSRDCTTDHDGLSSQQGMGTHILLQQDMGLQEDVVTRNVCGSSQRVTHPQDIAVRVAPTVRAEDTQTSPITRAEEATSAPASRAEEAASAPASRAEEAASAPASRAEEATSAPASRAEEATSAPAARAEEATSAPASRAEEATSVPASRAEEATSAPAARAEEATSAPAARAEEATSAPAARAEEAASAPAARAEEAASAPAARAQEATSAPAARAQEATSAPAARAQEATSAPTARSENVKSAQQEIVQQKQGGSPSVGDMTQMTPISQNQMSNLPSQPSVGWSSLSPIRVTDPTSPHRNMSSKPPLPIPPRSNLYPGHLPREQETSTSHETASLSSFKSKAPAPDTLSYLDSVSLMSGTMESLTLLDDASSLGSDSEINGMPYRKTDKYGFLGGNQYSGIGDTSVPVEIARQRELKWLEMFSNWDKWLTRRFQKVKLRCRKGIPSSLRAKAWQFLSNSHELLMKNPGKFEEMERQQGDPKWLDVIEKDLHRQFPFHEMFAARGGHGQQDLYRILKAYTVYRPEEGYCQAQAPVAAVLLMHMPAEQAFWCLVQICDKYLPGYYSAGLEAIQLDGEIFFALLRRVCPMAYRHLKKFKIDPILYMTEWFMCIFSRTLPWASVLRVWDMFFCEGVKIVFRVGLVLLRHTLGSVDKLRSCQGMYETMEKLRSLPVHCMQEEVLLPEVGSLPVTDALIERESNTQLRKWRENRGELQYRPSRRLHGARQIYEEKLRLNPTLSGSRLSLSSIRRPSPPATPALTVQPESVVVSEGLRPALPSPTANKAPLGPPRESAKKGKEKQREQEKKREKEEREREKKREKEEREERRKEREREKQKEKEEKRVQKEKEKAEARQKKERKFSFRRKESSTAADSPRDSGPGATDGSVAHDTYF